MQKKKRKGEASKKKAVRKRPVNKRGAWGVTLAFARAAGSLNQHTHERAVEIIRTAELLINNQRGKTSVFSMVSIVDLGDKIANIYRAFLNNEISYEEQFSAICNSLDLVQVEATSNSKVRNYLVIDSQMYEQSKNDATNNFSIKDFAYDNVVKYYGGTSGRIIYKKKRELEKDVARDPFRRNQGIALNIKSDEARNIISEFLAFLSHCPKSITDRLAMDIQEQLVEAKLGP